MRSSYDLVSCLTFLALAFDILHPRAISLGVTSDNSESSYCDNVILEPTQLSSWHHLGLGDDSEGPVLD
jgi:hypothetical protein